MEAGNPRRVRLVGSQVNIGHDWLTLAEASQREFISGGERKNFAAIHQVQGDPAIDRSGGRFSTGRFFTELFSDLFIGNRLCDQRIYTIQLCATFCTEHGSSNIFILAICTNDHEINSFLDDALNKERVPYLIFLLPSIVREFCFCKWSTSRRIVCARLRSPCVNKLEASCWSWRVALSTLPFSRSLRARSCIRYNINRDNAWTIFGGGGSVSGESDTGRFRCTRRGGTGITWEAIGTLSMPSSIASDSDFTAFG